ncbi:MAG: arginine deiminase family protein [Gemmatimonadota bacterium]|nr:arginine deiminase family protein [Gemmatimonadota bacterium]MDH3368972.1 arginine deiminase family protein [Gemmatimonadota bacterium]MDH3478989.1 arginine deiminase family protein [Gemmatimonadota bacterium]MDH3570583.1 arginine deiminase family protein [Gemmatimonadota bacterium]MDH5549686.1 arginine deiminase family protein [Gemmatimonadota bacterium]
MNRSRRVVAVTRPPTEALARCELTHLDRQPIDIALALAQHRAYEACLARLGAEVMSLPPEPDLPDAVFVEDVAVVLDRVAIITRPGAPSRRRERASTAAALKAFRSVQHVAAPAMLDGGDVLCVGKVLYVGRSTRTDAAGIAELERIAAPFGYVVRPVAVTGCLHLKSACSYVGDGMLLVNRNWIDAAAVQEEQLVDVPPGEPHAANTLMVGDTVVAAVGFPRTVALLERLGRTVETVELSELRKAEAGGSCMSVIFEV